VSQWRWFRHVVRRPFGRHPEEVFLPSGGGLRNPGDPGLNCAEKLRILLN